MISDIKLCGLMVMKMNGILILLLTGAGVSEVCYYVHQPYIPAIFTHVFVK